MENLIGSRNLLEFQLVSLISKEFLRKALDCDDFQFNIIGRAALVYLSTLYFATSEYKTVIDLCSTALMDQPTGFLKVWKLRITILLKTNACVFINCVFLNIYSKSRCQMIRLHATISLNRNTQSRNMTL